MLVPQQWFYSLPVTNIDLIKIKLKKKSRMMMFLEKINRLIEKKIPDTVYQI